jgi:hypothetical protein
MPSRSEPNVRSDVADVATTTAEAKLLLNAAWLLRRRSGESASRAAMTLAQRLEQLAGELGQTGSRVPEETRRSAVALAHRVLDDDHPEHSDMWSETADTPS